MSDDDDEILSDHQWKRTTLVPPLIDSIGESLGLVKWAEQRMPDFLWLGLLFEELGGKRAVDISVAVSKEAKDIHGELDFVLTTDFDELSTSQLDELKSSLSDDMIDDLKLSLEPLIANYPTYPLNTLFEEVPESEDGQIGYLADLVRELSDRESTISTYVQAMYIGNLMANGGLKIDPDSDLTDINEVFKYPDTERSKQLASVVRASTKAMNSASEGELDQSDWTRRFWQRGFEFTDCKFPQELEDDNDSDDKGYPDEEFFEDLVAIGREYEEELRTTILDIWWDSEFDAEFTGKHEVLDGLLFKQVNLSTSLVQTPTMWSNDIGQIILRVMSDTHITLEWLNKNDERKYYQDFIEYGLGQEKLHLEHQNKIVNKYGGEDERDLEEGLNQLENKLAAQRAIYLLPVDVGHWANKNTRQLAEEADCKEGVYDIRFNQYSASVHPQWNAIERDNLVTCQNPLHQYHKIPEFRPVYKNPYAIVEAGNLMNRSFMSWIEARDIEEPDPEIPDIAATVKEILSEYGME